MEHNTKEVYEGISIVKLNISNLLKAVIRRKNLRKYFKIAQLHTTSKKKHCLHNSFDAKIV